jgi:hypothetical protein
MFARNNDEMAWVCERSLAGVMGSNPAGGMKVYRECCMCCDVEVSATCQSFVSRILTVCDMSECDIETSTKRRLRPTRAVEP